MDASVNRKLRRKGHETEGKDTHESENSYKRPGGRTRKYQNFPAKRKDSHESEFSYNCPGTFPTDDGWLKGRCCTS